MGARSRTANRADATEAERHPGRLESPVTAGHMDDMVDDAVDEAAGGQHGVQGAVEQLPGRPSR